MEEVKLVGLTAKQTALIQRAFDTHVRTNGLAVAGESYSLCSYLAQHFNKNTPSTDDQHEEDEAA